MWVVGLIVGDEAHFIGRDIDVTKGCGECSPIGEGVCVVSDETVTDGDIDNLSKLVHVVVDGIV